MRQSYSVVLVTAKGDGTALTAAAAASCIPTDCKYGLPANFFSDTGVQLQIKASGRISSVITTPGTARFDLRLGGTVVWDSGAISLETAAAHTNMPWLLDVTLTCRAIGPTATLIGQGTFTCEDIVGATAGSHGASVPVPWNTAPVVGNTFDSTAALLADLFFTQTVATGSLTLHQYSLISLN